MHRFNSLKTFMGIIVTSASILVLAGCAGLVKLDVESSTDLNSAGSSGPLPVVVRIYSLEDDNAFNNADFYALWKQDEQLLARSLILKKEVVIQPGTVERIEFPFDSKMRFVAGMAIFRNPSRSEWRFIEPVPNNILANAWHQVFSASLGLRLSQNRIEIVN